MVKKIKFNDLSNGTQTMIILAFAISVGLLIISYMPDKSLENVARWNCSEEKNYSKFHTCFDKCGDIVYSNISFICDPNIEYDCERTRIKGTKASEDYEICVRTYGCLDINPEIKEVCEII